jgi:1-acyl-sn-glycerol-3-phosphate acyltransferase
VNLRAAWRAVVLGLALLLIVVRFWRGRLRGPYTLVRRAEWMQDAALLVLGSMGIRCTVQGTPPPGGIVVANHLSYLDIAVISAAMPCFFVAKAEIDRWPFFGKAARSGGTIFIDRASRASAEAVTRQIAQRMGMSVPVLFFPEGTTSDGSELLRFRSRLFAPAVAAAVPITAASLRYVVADGTPEREVAWFGDDSFLPHLWKLLGMAGMSAEVRFGEPRIYRDRREAADRTRAEIAGMREQSVAALR